MQLTTWKYVVVHNHCSIAKHLFMNLKSLVLVHLCFGFTIQYILPVLHTTLVMYFTRPTYKLQPHVTILYMNGAKDLWCSSTVWLLSTQM